METTRPKKTLRPRNIIIEIGNVRTMYESGQTAQVAAEMRDYKQTTEIDKQQ